MLLIQSSIWLLTLYVGFKKNAKFLKWFKVVRFRGRERDGLVHFYNFVLICLFYLCLDVIFPIRSHFPRSFDSSILNCIFSAFLRCDSGMIQYYLKKSILCVFTRLHVFLRIFFLISSFYLISIILFSIDLTLLLFNIILL